MEFFIISFLIFVVICVASFLIFNQYQAIVRDAKNYERGLKNGSNENSSSSAK